MYGLSTLKPRFRRITNVSLSATAYTTWADDSADMAARGPTSHSQVERDRDILLAASGRAVAVVTRDDAKSTLVIIAEERREPIELSTERCSWAGDHSPAGVAQRKRSHGAQRTGATQIALGVSK